MKQLLSAPILVALSVGLSPTFATAAVDSTKVNVRYCGIGFAGTAVDKAKTYPALSKILVGADLERSNKDFRALADNGGANINLVDSAEGASYGLSYVVTGETVESQPFIHPLNKRRQYNNIYSIKIQTVVFDINSKQIVSIYPAVIQFNEASAEPLNSASTAARYAQLVRDANLQDSPFRQWAESIKEIGFNLDSRSIAVTPVVISDEARATMLSETGTGAAPDYGKLIRNLTADYEARLAVGLKKPIVPAAIDSNGMAKPSDQYIAAIPGCLGQGDVEFKLPSPAYRFRFQVERLKSGAFEHETATGGATSVKQKELAYGARFRVAVVAVDDSDSVNGGITIDEQTLRFTSAKWFAGERTLDTQEQYYKLTVGFMDALIKNMVSPDEKWIKEQLSAEAVTAKVKPATIKKAWVAVFKNRVAVATASR